MNEAPKSLVIKGQALEGEKVSGQARKPLLARGMSQVGGRRVQRYVAEFDVRSKIKETAEPPPWFENEARMTEDAELLAEKAIITSLDGRPSTKIDKGSHTHFTNFFDFGKRTSVRIDLGHAQIQAALEKRAGGLPQDSTSSDVSGRKRQIK